MKALIGNTLKQAKEIAKQEIGVKRMGDARFKMILDEGVKRGDFIIRDDKIIAVDEEDFEDFFDLEIIEDDPPIVETKTIHPKVVHIDPKLSSSDLPREGDFYYYRSYTGDVVQGEVKSTICFVECQNPDGTWQTVAFQDLYLKKKGVSKQTSLNHLRSYYQNNDHLKSERNQLLAEIERLKAKIESMKSN